MDEILDRELLKGIIDILILKLIKKYDSLYGYDIAKKIYSLSENKYKMKEGTLYLALKRLNSNMYLESFWNTSENDIRRKYYKITNEGLKYLEQKEKSLNYLYTLINKI